MDKFISGTIFEKYGIPVPETKIVNASELTTQLMPFPYVVKPIDGGSSIGVYIIKSEQDLKNIDWTFGEKAMVQKYIPGRELTVGIFADKALEVTEIVPKNGFYDYKNKYSDGATMHILPAPISSAARAKIMGYAEMAHKALGCRGASRVDFRYDENADEMYILEINTQPGMTPLSLFPEQAKMKGISFEELIKWMVDNSCYDQN